MSCVLLLLLLLHCPVLPSLFFLRAPGGAPRGPVVEVFLRRPQPGPRPLSGQGPGPPPPPVLLPPPSPPKLAHLRPGPPRIPLRLACLAPPLTPSHPPRPHTPTQPGLPLGPCSGGGCCFCVWTCLHACLLLCSCRLHAGVLWPSVQSERKPPRLGQSHKLLRPLDGRTDRDLGWV